MQSENGGYTDFLLEMSEHHISAREFFSNVLLDSLERNFGLKNVVIYYFDTEGRFLSWINRKVLQLDCDEHPYRQFIANDAIRHVIYQDAVRERLTYFNVIPRLYKATDIIHPIDYANSAYVRCLKENFHAYYSVTMAFGMNAYIQVAFLKTLEQGDFTEAEMDKLKKIYVYIANSYKNFKKHEQAKIVANIQSEIISSEEKAYLVTDDFLHIMSCNKEAVGHLEKMLGYSIENLVGSMIPCNWLPFLFGDEMTDHKSNRVHIRNIKDYIFKIYTYDQGYSNGIIDRYHWITICQNCERKKAEFSELDLPLTLAEQKVARLMYNGLTYKDIADELVISYHTVKKHVQNIYTKCGVTSRFQLHEWIEKHR